MNEETKPWATRSIARDLLSAAPPGASIEVGFRPSVHRLRNGLCLCLVQRDANGEIVIDAPCVQHDKEHSNG